MSEPRYMSMSDPIYFYDAKETAKGGAAGERAAATGDASQGAAAAELSPITRPAVSRKASKVLLKVTRKRALAPQSNASSSQMLPPGCSMSDPSYSLKDPVYFFGK